MDRVLFIPSSCCPKMNRDTLDRGQVEFVQGTTTKNTDVLNTNTEVFIYLADAL